MTYPENHSVIAKTVIARAIVKRPILTFYKPVGVSADFERLMSHRVTSSPDNDTQTSPRQANR